MLTVILSEDWIRGRDAILDMVTNDVHNQIPGCILLVPELISHDMERRLCAAAGDTASRFAEVLSFTGLARRVNEESDFSAPEFMDKGGRLVAMAASALQLHSKLKAYASVETRPEFLTALVDAVDEFKCCCINPADLRAASKQSEGSLAQKLEEIALLLEAYDAICAQGKRDPRDQMTWLLEELEACGYAQKHRFYIDGFPDFTRQHMAILEHLIASDTHVVISMNCNEPDSRDPAWEKAGKTTAEIIRYATKHGIQISYIKTDPLDGPLQGLGQLLFRGKIHNGQYSHSLKTIRTETPYDECCVVADSILELVSNGVRYRDIGVVCADIDGYKSTISMVFNRCSIPSYLSGTEDILDKSVLNTVLTALDAAIDGFGQQEVLRYLKSLLSPLEPQICDKIENYSILWSISGNRWCTEWVNHPVELNGKWNDYAHAQLQMLNDIRQQFMTPLVRLRSALVESATLREQIKGVYQFLEDIRFADRLAKLADHMDQKGDNRSAQILGQLWEILMCAMEQLHDTLGDTAWDGQTFVRLFKLILGQYDVGTIPTVLDSVTVGPFSAMRCQETKHLFVLGALDGFLPGCSITKGVLSDQDRTTLRKLGVPVNGGSVDNLQVDFAEIYGVFNGALESICVLCPSGQPSYVYQRLQQLVGGEIVNPVYFGAALTDSMEAAAYLARWNDKKSAEALGLLEEYKQVIACRDYTMGDIDRQRIIGLYGEQLNLSASQIDRQAECRMSYFLKYGLRLKERKSATIDPAEFGTYVHAVMENTVNTVMQNGGFRALSLQRVMDIATEYSDAYAKEFFSQLESQRIGYLFRRNVHELMLVVQELWNEMQTSDFTPVGVEVGFGKDEDMQGVDVSGLTMAAILNGYVDRVDLWNGSGNHYFRVVDYKTGKKDFDYCDIYNGIGLQMLLYLFALEENGQKLLGDNPRSAGVQYFPARVSIVNSEGALSAEEAEKKRMSEWKRKGLVLNDKDVLYAMENSETPRRLSVTVSKDGTYSGDLANREQLRMLKKYVFNLVGNMVDDIASGNISPNPYMRGSSHSACMYCPYGEVCHRSQVEDVRNYKAMKAIEFWQRVEREVNGNG